MGFLSKETPGQQAANARIRKGTKRPEHGEWPKGKMTSHEKALNKKKRGHLKPNEGGNQPDWSSN